MIRRHRVNKPLSEWQKQYNNFLYVKNFTLKEMTLYEPIIKLYQKGDKQGIINIYFKQRSKQPFNLWIKEINDFWNERVKIINDCNKALRRLKGIPDKEEWNGKFEPPLELESIDPNKIIL